MSLRISRAARSRRAREVYNICSGRGTSIAGVVELLPRSRHDAADRHGSRARAPRRERDRRGVARKIHRPPSVDTARTLEESLQSVYRAWFDS